MTFNGKKSEHCSFNAKLNSTQAIIIKIDETAALKNFVNYKYCKVLTKKIGEMVDEP